MKEMELEEFLEEMDYDLDIVNMVISEYIASLNSQIPKLDRLFKARDYTVITREAHSIKGGARNLMAPELEDVSAHLEQAAKNHDDSEIARYLITLQDKSKSYELYVKENLARYSAQH